MKADQIVATMLEKDAFSQWLGIAVVSVSPGSCTLEMTIQPVMTNGFGMAHGGITYALADSALAFAANGHGKQCVSIDTSINHITPLYPGDKITANAREEALKNKFGFYTIEIKKDNTVIALFKGTVFRSEQTWITGDFK